MQTKRDVTLDLFFSNTEMCNMQMQLSVLPMRYATIVPQHAIDRLLTIELGVNFL